MNSSRRCLDLLLLPIIYYSLTATSERSTDAKKQVQSSLLQWSLTMRAAPPAGTPTGSSAALGAYILLKEIAAQEPAAPSWQFLQQRWAAVRASAAAAASASSAGAAGSQASQGAAAGSAARLAEEAAALLLVISETAAGFPADQAQALAAELLQVRGVQAAAAVGSLPSCMCWACGQAAQASCKCAALCCAGYSLRGVIIIGSPKTPADVAA